MAETLSNQSKTTASVTNQERGEPDVTWDEATFTWDAAPGTWDAQHTVLSNSSKTTASVTNVAKS